MAAIDPDPSLVVGSGAALIHQYDSRQVITFARVHNADGTDAGLVRVTTTEDVGRSFDLDRNQLSPNFNVWIDSEAAKGKPDAA